MKTHHGTVIVPGRAYGKLLVIEPKTASRSSQTKAEAWDEVLLAKDKLSLSLKQRSQDPSLTTEAAAIFEAHDLMLHDPEFLDEIRQNVEAGLSSDEAIIKAGEVFSDLLSSLDDEYLQARASDILDIAQQLISPELPDVSGKIVLKEEIFPSEVIEFTKNGAIGFLSLKGSATSHASILAKNAGLPFITNLEPEVLKLQGDIYLDDAVLVDLSDEEIKAFHEKLAQDVVTQAPLARFIKESGVSQDGIKRQVSANISSLDDLKQALAQGAEGVALFRTEFLFMQKHLPKRAEQVLIYESLAQELQGKSFIIRTMDLGGG